MLGSSFTRLLCRANTSILCRVNTSQLCCAIASLLCSTNSKFTSIPFRYSTIYVVSLASHTIAAILAPRWLRASPPTAPLPGGRRLAAARTGVSDCAGFAPNINQKRLALTALSLTPCHPPSSSVSSLRPCRLVFPSMRRRCDVNRSLWFWALIVCLRFLAERLSANGREFSQGRANASRRVTLTGSSLVCRVFRQNEGQAARRIEESTSFRLAESALNTRKSDTIHAYTFGSLTPVASSRKISVVLVSWTPALDRGVSMSCTRSDWSLHATRRRKSNARVRIAALVMPGSFIATASKLCAVVPGRSRTSI